MSVLQDLEQRTGLPVKQMARLLGCPDPTYYQYRRTGRMPPLVERFVTILLSMPEAQLNRLITQYVYDDEL